MPYDEDQIANLEAELDALVSPSTEDVLFYSEDYDPWIAVAIALRIGIEGGGGGGGGGQPLDSDLTAIAALTTTPFGRGLLELANQAALLSAAGAAAAVHAHAGEDITSGTVADARIASTIARDSEVTSAVAALSTVYQPLDSDLTAIAALTTTSFGRAVLALADAAALRTAAGLVIGTDVEAHDADLTTIAGLSASNDDLLQRKAGAWANRTIAQLLVDLAAAGTTFQPLDSDLTAFAGLSIAADKLPYGTGSHTLGLTDLSSFMRTVLDDADAATARTTLGVASDPIAWTWVTKSADESVASSTAVQNDDELFFTAVNGAMYEFDLILIYASPAGGGTPDLAFDLGEDSTVRGGTDYGIHVSAGDGGGGQNVVLTNQTGTIKFGTAAANRIGKVNGVHAGAGGTFRVRWAQQTNGVNATIVRAGSVLRYRRIL